MKRAYKVVDVFSEKPLLGNPVAVVIDAADLDTAAMQNIARWTHLSETTFLLPPTSPDADYRLRIFTPRGELPFAGHPTLGSAWAALEAGRVKAQAGRPLIQESAVGLVEVAVEDAVEASVEGSGTARRLTLTLPSPRVTPLCPGDVDELEAVLGHPVERGAPPAIIDVGAVWVVAQVSSAARLLALEPDFLRCAAFERRLGITGISLFGKHETGDADIEVRSFAATSGVNEDPVCGSGNGSVAVFRHARGLLPPGGARYIATQGQCVGSSGRVHVWVDAAGRVQLGGACITCVDGTLLA